MIVSVSSKLPIVAPILSASRNVFASRFFGSKDKKDDFSYTYQSPGSSVRDPLNIDTQEPVVLFDPPAKTSIPTRPAPKKEAPSGSDYIYQSPGSSVRDPIHISTSDPVLMYEAPKTEPATKTKRESNPSKYSYSRKKSPKEILKEEPNSFIYQSPGSSIRDPLNISTSDPVLFYDPPTSSKGIENVPGRINTPIPSAPKERKYTSTYARKKVEKVEAEEASYTYASPGSSIRDPVNISTNEPVHFYDAADPDVTRR
uniref:Uncharacterized protein n=1 Tax=Polytomella parva TaxID=51329 RepID=A0A7S0UJL4_9CHLO|eukprot:CAMPEP_0175054218 /NCGR_PEP_ID=MMETSP0052_2-20121109/9379_1 /TAXON_ID=51329 ORGANISM="Polytomella parva, Strain SAG 63-3" /NCGR_SAMPLE_ID=MMETSP0052_2 /ASSEMBLY_ACC=CAM_ASM_000194 /LENGTH=256 /DNA_ID=CAMNT_0016318881 /DNA_START=54 /DNA_END=824 /DNA_ORIENTATION=-